MKLCFVVFYSFLLFFSLTVCGQSKNKDTVKALENLNQALEKEKALAPDTKEALQNLIKALHKERTKPKKSKKKHEKDLEEEVRYLEEEREAYDHISWDELLDRLKIYGDIRLRHESDVFRDNQKERHRQRIRFRIGFEYLLTGEFKVGARLVTGDPDDPNSTHVTLGDTFDSFEVSLDRVYASYRPQWLKGLTLTGGKFQHPFYKNPIYGELVWDYDIQPEVIVASYLIEDLDPLKDLEFIAGWYRIREQGAFNSVFVSTFQIKTTYPINEDLMADLAVGYYHYSDVTPDGDNTIVLNDDAGNSLEDDDGDGINDDFGARFGIINPILAFTYKGWKYPVTLSGEYINNIRAGDRHQGFAVGASLGKKKKKGDWYVYYQYQIIGQDAVFSPVAQDDFIFSTNHRSHMFGINYQLWDFAAFHLFAMVTRQDRGSDQHQLRIRADLNIKF